MRIIVTGSTGFVGRHLLAALPEGATVHTVSRGSGPGNHHGLDLRDEAAVRSLLTAVRPDVVVHLAAIAQVRDHSASAVRAVNVDAAAQLAASLWAVRPGARLLAVSTGYVHGETTTAAAEDAPLNPVGPYATSKAEMETAVRAVSRGRDLCIVRPFNHTGPGQSASHAVPAFIEKARAVASGAADHLAVGDLSAVRDLADVRDLAQGLVRLVGMSELPSMLQVCSGQGRTMATVLQQILDLVGVPDAPVRSVGRSVLRQNIGDPKCARSLGIGARPLASTLGDMLRL